VLLLHFGAEETEIDLMVGNSLMFSRSAAVKIPSADAPKSEMDESVSAVAMEVRRSVQSYLVIEQEFKIDSILIAGGTGIEAIAAEQLSAELKAPCQLFNPSFVQGFSEDIDPSAFISALGLAVGHSGRYRLPFDFLHPKRPAVKRNRARAMGITAAAVLLLAGVVVGTAGAIQVAGKRAAVNSAREAVRKERANLKKLQHIEKQVKSIQEWQDQRRDWLAHWAKLSSLFPGARDAYVSGLKTAADGSMSFQVKARDSKIITDIGISLAEAGYKFQPGGLTSTPNPHGYPYSAEIRVFIDPDMEIDLSEVEPVPRPADDDSIRRLAKTTSDKDTPSPATVSPAPTPPDNASSESSGNDRSSWRRGRKSSAPLWVPEFRKLILAKCDLDKNGKLEKQEIGNAYQFIKESRYARYFDQNRNGKFDRDEYYRMRDFLREWK